MKKEKIIFSLIFVLLISSMLILVINKNNKKYVMQDGIMLALSLDGNNIVKFPEGTNYRVEVECENATGTWLVEDWKLSISDITDNVVCDVDFYTRNSNDLLLNVVENDLDESKIIIEIGDYTNSTTLSESEYGNVEKYYYAWDDNWENQNVYTDASEVFSYNGTSWTTNPVSSADDYYTYKLKFSVPSDGYYLFCYNMTEYDDGDMNNSSLSVINNDVSILNVSNYDTTSGCVDVGNFNKDDYLEVGFSYYEAENVTSSFYFKKSDNGYDENHYRYSGSNPNNYLWFNNEMWRIIGSIPTKIDSSGNQQNLIKVIRNDSLERIVSHVTPDDYDNTPWGSNTLYTLLNNYYYGKKDGTDSGYCYGYYGSATYNYKSNCDYRLIGISNDPSEYYGKMVKKVYWNTGNEVSGSASIVYKGEKSNQNVIGFIGVKNVSDSRYATISDYYNSSITSNEAYSNNWLYRSLDVVRPVVYLDPSVYVVSGDGTELYPYQITME